jgi:hypothetical protein
MVSKLSDLPWALRNSWNPDECQVIRTVSGHFAIVDHSIQCLVALAESEAEARDWLKEQGRRQEVSFVEDHS